MEWDFYPRLLLYFNMYIKIKSSTISMEGGTAIKDAPGCSTRQGSMLPFPSQMRFTKYLHTFGQLHQQCMCCENQRDGRKSVSYLATWQHGDVKLMPSNARHIPGPGARQWCNSGSATSPHSANQSSPASSPPPRVTTVTFFPSLAPKNRWGRKRCHDQDGGVQSEQKPTLTLLPVGPSAEEGLRHVNMTHTQTSSCRAC